MKTLLIAASLMTISGAAMAQQTPPWTMNSQDPVVEGSYEYQSGAAMMSMSGFDMSGTNDGERDANRNVVTPSQGDIHSGK